MPALQAPAHRGPGWPKRCPSPTQESPRGPPVRAKPAPGGNRFSGTFPALRPRAERGGGDAAEGWGGAREGGTSRAVFLRSGREPPACRCAPTPCPCTLAWGSGGVWGEKPPQPRCGWAPPDRGVLVFFSEASLFACCLPSAPLPSPSQGTRAGGRAPRRCLSWSGAPGLCVRLQRCRQLSTEPDCAPGRELLLRSPERFCRKKN